MMRHMSRSWLEELKTRLAVTLRFFLRRRGVLFRGIICWSLGMLALTNDEVFSYDERLQIRGPQKVSSDIVLIIIRPTDLIGPSYSHRNSLLNVSEIADLTDSYFWNPILWQALLDKILSQNPTSVGVSLYFGENIGSVNQRLINPKLFEDPRVVWSNSTNYMERVLQPAFANNDETNIGSNEIKRDEDGVVRRIFPLYGDEHLLEKMSKKTFPNGHPLPINYRGSARVFPHYSVTEILNDEWGPDLLKGKYVLIGAETGAGLSYITPLGSMNRVEILAHMLDNLLADRWIKRFHTSFYALLFVFLVAFGIIIITQYPQSVALIFFFWISTLFAALSAWVFDSFYIWLPAFSPFIVLATVWVIFIGYQATKIERVNYQLKQEQKYLQELEQLKNNFVSLISHDLKTPIAKIQAIIDRLLTQHQNPQLVDDLKTLRVSSDELNRYIQSILKVLRVESRDFKLHIEIGDINEIIEEAIHQLRPLADAKNISIWTHLEPMFSTEFDITLIKEVIINLVENAIKYTPTGGQITITSQEVDNEINVRVKDTGSGIAEDEIEHVWGKFTRGKGQDLKTKGTGLGLYLVKYFIELHGGTVQLESELNQGTTVSFTLPLLDDTTSASEEVTL
jgi:signal transduction histidine kinase